MVKRKVPYEKSFGMLYPELLKEYRGEQDPFTLAPKSHQKVKWQCSKNPRHTWEANISDRVRGNGCKYCLGREVIPEESFGTMYPEFVKKLSSNNTVDPFSLNKHSYRKVLWKCDCGYEWPAAPHNIIVRGQWCPRCSGSILSYENSFESKCPHLLHLWDFDKNKVKPSELSWCSGIKVWWICDKNTKHKWKASLANVSKGRGCKYCAGKDVLPEESFATLYPELLKEYRGEQDPFTLACKSHKRFEWECSCGNIN